MSPANTRLKALIAALCLAAQALVLGHYALVEHTRCAEHGALVHVEAHADEHPAEAHADAHVKGDAATDSVQTGEAAHDDGHEHCATTSERRKAMCGAAPVAITHALLPSQRAHVVVYVSSAGRAVHWIAPKTSPPV